MCKMKGGCNGSHYIPSPWLYSSSPCCQRSFESIAPRIQCRVPGGCAKTSVKYCCDFCPWHFTFISEAYDDVSLWYLYWPCYRQNACLFCICLSFFSFSEFSFWNLDGQQCAAVDKILSLCPDVTLNAGCTCLNWNMLLKIPSTFLICWVRILITTRRFL